MTSLQLPVKGPLADVYLVSYLHHHPTDKPRFLVVNIHSLEVTLYFWMLNLEGSAICLRSHRQTGFSS